MTGASLDQLYAEKLENQLEDFRGIPLFKLFEEHLLPGKILDVGCGTGACLLYFAQAGREIQGIDQSDRMIEMARASLRRFQLTPELAQKVSVEEIPDHSVENIICSDVLEHIQDDRAFFELILQKVKRNGRILITVPAMPSLYGPKDKAIGHFRRYSKGQLEALLQGLPVRVRLSRYWNFIGIAPTFIAVKLLKKSVSEDFRSNPSLFSKVIRQILLNWFLWIENRFSFSRGLSLILVLEKTAEWPARIEAPTLPPRVSRSVNGLHINS